MSDGWYYNFVNIDSAVKQQMIKDGIPLLQFRYIKDIVNTRISMFSYEGLPDGLTPQILETALMFCNKLCFYNSTELGGWILCRYIDGGEYDLYWKPKYVNLTTLNGEPVRYNVPYKDIVLIRDNVMDIIPFLCIKEYIDKIVYIEGCMEKILHNASLPIMVIGNKKQANALRTTAKSLGNSNPYIVGDDTLLDNVKSFDIEVPVNPLDVYDLKKKYLNECYSSLGIYAVDEKRERIVTQELVNQNDYTDFVYAGALEERKRCINELNSKGLNIKLKELYEENYQDTVDEKAQLAEAIAKAESKGDKQDGKQSK